VILIIFNFIYWFIYLFNDSQFGEMQFGEMPHFFNTPHAFKKIGETQPGEMPHTQFRNLEKEFFLYISID